MFEKIDLDRSMSDKQFRRIMPPLAERMGELQRAAAGRGIPAIIVFEGMDGSEKGVQINQLIQPLDPRGFDVYAINDPNDAERARPFFWRFWVNTPARGRLAVFSRSWYHRTIVERRHGKNDPQAARWANEINLFERALADDDYLILKLYLHISKKEQKRRYRILEKDPATSWRVTDKQWDGHKKFDKYLSAMESLMERTDMAHAPWIIVEANDRNFAAAKIITTVIEAYEKAVARARGENAASPAPPEATVEIMSLRSSVLDRVDLSQSMTSAEYDKKLPGCEDRMRKAQMKAYASGVPIVVVFEGWDAAGKGGDIKRLTANMDPRGYTVVPIRAPSPTELAHNYLWRFCTRFPAAGHFTIFDRSWYGRVLVERVEGLCRPDEWQRAYAEINEMEEHLVNSGTVLVKFWLHIDQNTQLKRFEDRERNPEKEWKLSVDDWRNRGKWNEYWAAADEMLYRTSTDYAPWTIIESNDKNFSRIKVLQSVAAAVEEKLGELD
ncbi:MAG TPA: polyphosphate:AMP phosphotransferase [Methanocella sp.]|uniref:polyphosphate:AMP phosphotransferase n=1 Tax=Methanocella sp. TaxID=2052833 RepID=UPI002C3A19BE|nr:polyphosphate:AMP phosphotransferase [Methanocella sp.]HTY90478.1 polyphosphate:AMP phosphotransferase [Methanocella sp.]